VIGEPPPPATSSSFERLPAILPGIQGTQVTLHEGLPDAFWDPNLRGKEIRSKKIVQMHGHPLYEDLPALKDGDKSLFTAIMSASPSYLPYSGPKSTGEYNADYCLTWKGASGETQALISLQCGEVKLFGPKSDLHCDLTPQALDQLKRLLDAYQKNRPAK
jgi:hypothetical protein